MATQVTDEEIRQIAEQGVGLMQSFIENDEWDSMRATTVRSLTEMHESDPEAAFGQAMIAFLCLSAAAKLYIKDDERGPSSPPPPYNPDEPF